MINPMRSSSRPFLASLSFALLAVGASSPALGQVQAERDGRLIRYQDRLLVLVGDSGSQCVLQNLNIDYRAWIDTCAAAGLNAVHVWSFMAPRQSRDGKVVERRYGYLYPGVTPWRRHSDGPAAHDGWPRWNLQEFDEGDDPHKHYWPRLRDLCQYAKQKKMVVGITVFFGWPKHQSDWAYHPLNVANGGHLMDRRPTIEVAQQIATPGTEVLDQPWSPAWHDAYKTQWIWERFSAKLIKETLPIGNTFYVFMDERSYSEGNCGDHFAKFFQRRNAFWIDGQLRRESVDAVIGGHGAGRDINQAAQKSFARQPHRPFFEFELPPYRGAAVRQNLYACLLGGGHYFFHNDERQETPTTGIMAYDPNVPKSRREAVRLRLRWLGIASRLINQRVRQRRGMRPSNDVMRHGSGYCLARPGREYVVYIKSGGKATLRLDRAASDFDWPLISPRTGQVHSISGSTSGNELRLELPDSDDWIIHLTRR